MPYVYACLASGSLTTPKPRVQVHSYHSNKVAEQATILFLQAIRAADDGPAARASLVSGFGLSEAQAEGVLGLTLRRLTGLEAGKLREEAAELQASVAQLQVGRRA